VRFLPGLILTLVAAATGSGVPDTIAQNADRIEVTARSRSVQPGELVVLTIVPSSSIERLQLRAFDRELAAFRTTAAAPDAAPAWQALVGIDLDVKAGTYPVAIDADAGRFHTTYELVVAPKRFPTRRLTVNEAFVNPPASEQERIQRDAKLLESVWNTPSAERLWTAPFVRPVAEPANSRFGTRSIFNGVPRNPHGGADFLSPSGTPIHAPNAGRVAVARDLYFSGNTVVIDHGLGLFSMLAHLSAIDAREGDRVTTGEVVGRVGATGRVTGPHLHWAVRAAGARVDPIALLTLLGEEKTR
jgi:murein DD-endopeptidase MepM/ murein hydrolase activator NlpD